MKFDGIIGHGSNTHFLLINVEARNPQQHTYTCTYIEKYEVHAVDSIPFLSRVGLRCHDWRIRILLAWPASVGEGAQKLCYEHG